MELVHNDLKFQKDVLHYTFGSFQSKEFDECLLGRPVHPSLPTLFQRRSLTLVSTARMRARVRAQEHAWLKSASALVCMPTGSSRHCTGLQCVAVCCSVLHYVAVCCSVLQFEMTRVCPLALSDIQQ